MVSAFSATALVLGLASSPALCLPKPGLDNEPRAAVHHARSIDQMANWKIVAIFFGGFVGVLLLCMLGGACETMLCHRRAKGDYEAAPNEIPPTHQGASQSSIRTSTTLRGETERPDGEEKCMSFGSWKGGSAKGRYSWHDEQGVTTEVFQDGSMPDAGRSLPALRVVNADGYQPGETMASHGQRQQQQQRRQHQQRWDARSPAGGPRTPHMPEFTIGDEQDEAEYERELSLRPGDDLSPLSLNSPTAVWVDDSVHTTPTKGPRMPWADDDSPIDESTTEYSIAETPQRHDFDVQHGSGVNGIHEEKRDLLADGRRITHVFPWMPAEDR